MITPIFLISIIIVGILLYSFGRRWKSDGMEVAGLIIIVMFAVILLLSCGSLMINYHDQISDIQTMSIIDNKVKIAEDRYKELSAEFKNVLIVNYPAYEKEIFKDLNLSAINAFILKYPDLKNIEASKLYIDKISQMNDTIYILKNQKQDTLQRIRTRENNIFLTVPKYMEDKWVHYFLF